MNKRREDAGKLDFRPTEEVHQIIKEEMRLRKLSKSATIRAMLLEAARPDFKRQYKAALLASIQRLQAELRELEAE